MESLRRNEVEEQFKAVPAYELAETGVLDVMRTPGDGIDRNQWIEWGKAQLSVVASFREEGKQRKALHKVVVNNADGEGSHIAFGTEENSDGTVSIATVSGWHPEGRAKLSEEQSAVFKSLVERSIESGPEFRD